MFTKHDQRTSVIFTMIEINLKITRWTRLTFQTPPLSWRKPWCPFSDRWAVHPAGQCGHHSPPPLTSCQDCRIASPSSCQNQICWGMKNTSVVKGRIISPSATVIKFSNPSTQSSTQILKRNVQSHTWGQNSDLKLSIHLRKLGDGGARAFILEINATLMKIWPLLTDLS